MTNVLKNAQWDTDLRNKVENRNLKCTITIADLENLRAVSKFCPITGSELVYCRGMVNRHHWIVLMMTSATNPEMSDS